MFYKTIYSLLLAWALPLLAYGTVGCQDLMSAEIPLPRKEARVIDSIMIQSATPLGGSGGIPNYCEVTGTIDVNPNDPSVITFQLRLPEASAWNGRFLKIGNTGGGGALLYYSSFEQPISFLEATSLKPTQQGYANAVTDLGNQNGGDYTWISTEPGEEERNFIFRAVHLATVVSKELIKLHYGQPADYSYFSGCSTGGASALKAAAFYPRDFDGIVAQEGEPRRIGLFYKWLEIAQLNNPIGQAQLVDRATFLAAHQLAVAKCDGVDGMVDGQVREGYRCEWDPAVDLASLNLSPQQLAVFDAIYSPLVVDGKFIFPGHPPGSERGQVLWQSPDPIVQAVFGYDFLAESGVEFLNYAVFGDPSLGLHDIPLSSAKQAVKDFRVWDTKARYRGFLRQGGKLMQLSNYESGVSPYLMHAEISNRVLGYRPKLAKSYRHYILPLSGHCGLPIDLLSAVSGVGDTGFFDPLPYMIDWVENGNKPEIVDAAVGTSATPVKLCPYPDKLVDDGMGNFSCQAQTLLDKFGNEIIDEPGDDDDD